MYVEYDHLKRINDVQVQIFKEVVRVCEELDIEFFMVHGSLLGTIRNGGFIPYDDDIDIAMKRSDYDKFLSKAQALMDSNYFVQSVSSDKNYPLLFAKVRDIRTTYICEAVKNIDMNHGIYIDIFPIDNCKIRNTKIDLLAEKILNLRISSSLYTKHKTLKSQIFKIASCIFYPSLRRAIKKRDNLSKSASESGYVCITGGKSSERKIPAEWFTSAVADVFEGVSVYVPDGYDKYLRCIYGEYEKRTLVEGKMLGDSVELNACIVDTQKPYTEYVINNK